MPGPLSFLAALFVVGATGSAVAVRRERWFATRPILGSSVMIGLFAAVLALSAAPAFAQQGSQVAGRPYVTDGDTLRFGAVRVRLHGIQAPEMNTAEGQTSRRQLVALIGTASVQCVDTGQRSYDRIVARCYLGQQDLAGLLVASGWARDWPRFSGRRYAAAEAAARRAGRGLHAY